MKTESFEKEKEALRLKMKVIQAEWERLESAKTRNISDARKELKDRINTLVK